MSCECDYESPTLWHVEIRKARKPHRCCECGTTLQPGERYEHVVGVWGGYFDTYDTCARCLDVREFVKAHVPCFCLLYGGLYEEAEETIAAYSYQTVGLRFGYLRRRTIADRHRKQYSRRAA